MIVVIMTTRVFSKPNVTNNVSRLKYKPPIKCDDTNIA